MKHFEEFLHENSCQTSLACLLDSLVNWKKKSPTFQDAVETVEKMANHIEKIEEERRKEWKISGELLGKYGRYIEELEEKNKKLYEKIHELKKTE